MTTKVIDLPNARVTVNLINNNETEVLMGYLGEALAVNKLLIESDRRPWSSTELTRTALDEVQDYKDRLIALLYRASALEKALRAPLDGELPL